MGHRLLALPEILVHQFRNCIACFFQITQIDVKRGIGQYFGEDLIGDLFIEGLDVRRDPCDDTGGFDVFPGRILLTKPGDGSRGWVVAGIQQLN